MLLSIHLTLSFLPHPTPLCISLFSMSASPLLPCLPQLCPCGLLSGPVIIYPYPDPSRAGLPEGRDQFSSVAQSCPTLCNPMDCSTPGFPVHHQLPELAQTHIHQIGVAIQPSHPLSSPFPPAFNLSQRQSIFPTSHLFTSGGQSIRASASASVLPMNSQD